MKLLRTLALCMSVVSMVAGNPSKITTRKEFREALEEAIRKDPDHTNVDDALIDSYCDYIIKERKLDYKEYDDPTDFTFLVIHFDTYVERHKACQGISDKKTNDHGKEFVVSCGDNILTDVTDDELKKRGLPEEVEGQGAPRRLTAGCNAINGAAFANVNNQVQTDWSTTRCPHVYDQGPTNACWAFSTVGQAECNYGKYSNSNNKRFSIQHALDCSSNYEGTKSYGGWIDRLSNFEKGKGYCENYAFPFGPNDPDYNNYCNCGVPMKKSNCYYINLRHNFDAVTRIVADGYSFVFGMKFDRGLQNAAGNAVTSCNPYDGAFNHAMTIVGQYYGGWLRIKNSYGTNWADNGKIWITRDALLNCLLYDNIYLSYDFYNGASSAKVPQLNPQAKAPELKPQAKSSQLNAIEPLSETPKSNIFKGENYLYIISSATVGLIIGGICIGMICLIVIYCLIVKKSGHHSYKSVKYDSETDDEDEQV